MIIKNVIVLLDEINTQRRNGISPYDSIIEATISRTRPVLMAATTTILGMVPLLFDVAFGGMAATIIFGLTFATLLTLIRNPDVIRCFTGSFTSQITIKMDKVYIISGLLSFLSFPLIAQNSDYQAQYREKVLEYNQDLKAAGYNEAMKQEMIKSARADFKPKLSVGGNFNYTGNPLELSIDLPSMNSPLYFQGKDLKYGATLSLSQPIYTGGGIRANYQKARKEKELASNESNRIKSNTLHDADIYYWNAVAQHELVFVAQAFRTSIQQLVEVVRHRVEVEYIDRNDLLMAEVKLNDADFQLLQTRDNAEIARLALNSFAGVNPSDTLPIDHSVIALKQFIPLSDEIDNAITSRAGIPDRPKQDRVTGIIPENSGCPFLTQFHIGVDGSYSSPGYNFKSDLDPNYATTAKLSIPLFEWGKRKSTRNASSYAINMAQQNLSKTQDKIRLEIQTAHYNYKQAIDKVELTESSLSKASESEQMAMERYKEGNVSIVEVINAQLYHQQAQVNYIQSKLNAQMAKTDFERAIYYLREKE